MVDSTLRDEERFRALEDRVARAEKLLEINARDISKAFIWILVGYAFLKVTERTKTKTEIVFVEPGTIERFRP